jgi:hypothetical protein
MDDDTPSKAKASSPISKSRLNCSTLKAAIRSARAIDEAAQLVRKDAG